MSFTSEPDIIEIGPSFRRESNKHTQHTNTDILINIRTILQANRVEILYNLNLIQTIA